MGFSSTDNTQSRTLREIVKDVCIRFQFPINKCRSRAVLWWCSQCSWCQARFASTSFAGRTTRAHRLHCVGTRQCFVLNLCVQLAVVCLSDKLFIHSYVESRHPRYFPQHHILSKLWHLLAIWLHLSENHPSAWHGSRKLLHSSTRYVSFCCELHSFQF